MKNFQKSEIYKKFPENREEFKPYGLTSEKWEPALMSRFDRHNEIEINYIPEGSLTYMIKDRRVVIPSNRISMFWGLVPHQIIDFDEAEFYYVCTIPLSMFLNWKLPEGMTDKLLKGEILIDVKGNGPNDRYFFETWYNDINNNLNIDAAMLEMNARMLRFSDSYKAAEESSPIPVHHEQKHHIEKMSMFIAKNYTKGIRTREVSDFLGLHPDYANAIFKKAFRCSIGEYIKMEKITEAQRRLIKTDHSITDIAYDCGFNSISSFNCAFKAINGCTPREFRKHTLNISSDTLSARTTPPSDRHEQGFQ
jgi:AraC-like DNA-binding protein